MMTFNQFQKELRNRNIDGPTAVMLTTVYEQLVETTKQVDQCMSILVSLTEAVQKFTALHEATQGHVQRVYEMIRGNEKGVSVSSETITDEGDYNN